MSENAPVPDFSPTRRTSDARPRRTSMGTAVRAAFWGSLIAVVIVLSFVAAELPPPWKWNAPPSPDLASSAVTSDRRNAGGPSSKGQTQTPTATNLKGEDRREPEANGRDSGGRGADSGVPNADKASNVPGEAPASAPSQAGSDAATGREPGTGRESGTAANPPLHPSDEPASKTTTPKIAALLETLEAAVVKIEAGDTDRFDGLGSGFVLDASGLIATSYHVVADATAVRVRFKNGAAYDVAGYAAVDTDLDLAILKLRELPPQIHALELASTGDPPRLSEVVAIGHPQGVEFSPFDGKVSRVLTTSQLPAGSQRFLRQLISGRADHRWIQHTAGISEGNSGGPLLDDRGRVLGVNTWVDRQARFGYALQVSHLVELRSEIESDRVEPLRRYARKDARVADLMRRLTPEHLELLYDRAKKMGWRPDSEDDYDVLQQLAWGITVVQVPGTLTRGQIDDRLDALTRVVNRIVGEMQRQKWDSLGQLTIVNDHAAHEIDRPMAGVFFFASIERVVEGNDGARAALLRLAGADTVLLVPLDDQLTLPQAGQQCLVLGVNYDGQKVRYGENPLKLITAHVIVARTIIPL